MVKSRTLLFLFFAFAYGPYSFAQRIDSLYSACVTKPDTLDKQEVHIIADKMPQFPNGTGAMLSFIRKNIHYPAEQEEIQGSIYITCVIDTSGKVRNTCVFKTIGHNGDSPLDNEAVRVVSSMPQWIPGELKGQRVPVRMYIPIKIEIH
jgi:protein TonB